MLGSLGCVGGGGGGSSNWALTPDVTTDVDFVADRGFNGNSAVGTSTSFITTTRTTTNGTATAVWSTGRYSTFANNTARRTDLGLLCEEARTNTVRNSTLTGAVLGRIGAGGAYPTNWSDQSNVTGLGCTVVVTGSGTDANGVDYIELRISGAASQTNSLRLAAESEVQMAATYGQTWSSTGFLAMTGGSALNVGNVGIQSSFRNGGGTGLNPTGTSVVAASALTSTLTRVSALNLTATDSTTAFVYHEFIVGLTINLPVDITLRFGWPQTEQNQFTNSTVASATVQAGGSGYTNGAQTATLTGGTGTAATINVQVAGGIITGVNSITTPGSYTVFPISPAPFTITGAAGDGLGRLSLVPTNNAALGFASSPIKTTGAAAGVRTNDVNTLTTSPSFGTSYSLFAKATISYPVAYPNQVQIFQVSDGTLNQRTLIDATSGAATFKIAAVGGTGYSFFPTGTFGTNSKAAGAFAAADQAGAMNGGAVTTNAAATLPTTPTQVNIGSDASNASRGVLLINRIGVWAIQRITNAVLQSVTT